MDRRLFRDFFMPALDEPDDMDEIDNVYDFLPGQYLDRGAAVTEEQAEQAKSPQLVPATAFKTAHAGHVPFRLVNLHTGITPEHANHTYNGVVFFIHCNGPEAVLVHGFGVGGALGPVRVFAHREAGTGVKHSPDPAVWRLVFKDKVHPQPRHTHQLTHIMLQQPVIVQPEESMGFYIHVGTHDDEGLAYQSYTPGRPFLHSQHIQLTAGASRCGPHPFNGGWWRPGRGLAGSVLYEAIRLEWSPRTHLQFPDSFRRVVLALMMLWSRESSPLSVLPPELLFRVFSHMDYDWFEEEEESDQD